MYNRTSYERDYPEYYDEQLSVGHGVIRRYGNWAGVVIISLNVVPKSLEFPSSLSQVKSVSRTSSLSFVSMASLLFFKSAVDIDMLFLDYLDVREVVQLSQLRKVEWFNPDVGWITLEWKRLRHDIHNVNTTIEDLISDTFIDTSNEEGTREDFLVKLKNRFEQKGFPFPQRFLIELRRFWILENNAFEARSDKSEEELGEHQDFIDEDEDFDAYYEALERQVC